MIGSAALMEVPFADIADLGPYDWDELRAMLCKWTVRGCAVLRCSGSPMDVATVAAAAGPEGLAGVTFEVYHPHLARWFR